MVVVKFDPLSAAENNKVEIPVLVGGGVLDKVAGEEDPLAVHAADLVAGLQRALVGAAVGKAGDDGTVKAARAGIKNGHEHKPEQKIHRRARNEDEKAAPDALVVERPRIVRGFLLPFHGTEAADGKGAEGIDRFAPLLMQKLRAHAHGKLRHLHAARLGDKKVTQLMDKNQNAKCQNCKNNVHTQPISLRTSSRACASDARISSSVGCAINAARSTAEATTR